MGSSIAPFHDPQEAGLPLPLGPTGKVQFPPTQEATWVATRPAPVLGDVAVLLQAHVVAPGLHPHTEVHCRTRLVRTVPQPPLPHTFEQHVCVTAVPLNTTGASQGLLDGGHVLSSITLHSQEVQGAARVLGTQVQFRVYAYRLLSEAAVHDVHCVPAPFTVAQCWFSRSHGTVGGANSALLLGLAFLVPHPLKYGKPWHRYPARYCASSLVQLEMSVQRVLSRQANRPDAPQGAHARTTVANNAARAAAGACGCTRVTCRTGRRLRAIITLGVAVKLASPL